MNDGQVASLVTAIVAFLGALTAIAWQVNALLIQQKRNHRENTERLEAIERKVEGNGK